MSLDSTSSDAEDGPDTLEWKGERCEPLGAAKETLCDETDALDYDRSDSCELQRLHALEEEQEVLSSSLFSLTSHLAQVQFRLRQIVDAPPGEKEDMLKSLEEFTFRGIPDLGSIVGTGTVSRDIPEHSATCPICHKLDEKLKDQRVNQLRFIERLKFQLKELDSLSSDVPSQYVNKQEYFNHKREIIDDLKQNIERSLREGWQQPLTPEELRHQAMCSASLKKGADSQDLIIQLQSQVEDMQRFIKFLKNDSPVTVPESKPSQDKDKLARNEKKKSYEKSKNDELRAETVNLMKKVVALLQMFAVAQFGCSSDAFRKNNLKRTNIINHWGDLRARLEMSIDAVLNLLKHGSSRSGSAMGDYDSDSEENPILLQNVPLAIAVRKHLAINIRDLMQHGLLPMNEVNSVVPFVGCFPIKRGPNSKQMHAWELILRYYEISNGECYNSTPARKLSQSFNLDIVGNTAISNKESMLSAIGAIIASHKPYKRSYDSHFKAFVCAGLNANKLVAWLNVIFKNKTIMKVCYSSTSYVANTGFQDSLQSLDRLNAFKFDLPVDLAVRQFQNIKDVFM